MTTSLNETAQIDAHLLQLSDTGDALVFEARMLLEPALREKVQWQLKTYELISLYGRGQLKQEIEAVHQKLFSEPQHQSFRRKILRLFIKP